MELHDEVDEGNTLSDILKAREVGDDTSIVGVLDRNKLDAHWRPVYLKVELTGVEEPKTELELTPYPIDFRTIASKKKRRAAFRKVIARLVDLDRWKVELGAYIYSVPGQDDLLGAVRASYLRSLERMQGQPGDRYRDLAAGLRLDTERGVVYLSGLLVRTHVHRFVTLKVK